jgi:hypothetical protein
MQSETSFEEDIKALNEAATDIRAKDIRYFKRLMWFLGIVAGIVSYVILYLLAKY